MKYHKRLASIFICMIILAQFIIPLGETAVTAAQGTEEYLIRFLPTDQATPDDTLLDYGKVFEGKSNGLQYGWNIDHTNLGVTNSVYGVPDSITFLPGGSWEIAVPNGNYEVEVSVGDAVYGTSNTIFIEEYLLFDNFSLAPGDTRTLREQVQVSDGKLTITNGLSTERTSIRSVKLTVVPIAIPKFRQINPPIISLPYELNRVPGDKVIISGKQNNEHNKVPFIKLDGLDKAIDDYMNAEIHSFNHMLDGYREQAVYVDSSSIASTISNSTEEVIKIRTGHLNLNSSVTFGSPSKPVYLFVDGINTNNNLSLTVYGTLVINGNLNANQSLSIQVISPSEAPGNHDGSLYASGTIHLNNDSQVNVANDLIAGSLIYNNGQLEVHAGRVIVSNSMHINTRVTMSISDELLVGDLVSNNQIANIQVREGDFFIRNNISVNNHLDIQTGGVVGIGGNIVANRKPIISTGFGTEGVTKLKYALSGVKSEYYSEGDFTGDKFTIIEENINLNAKAPLSIPALQDGQFSVRWTGFIQPEYSEKYTFTVKGKGSVRLWINDELLIDQWEGSPGENSYRGSVQFIAGAEYQLRIEYSSSDNSPKSILSWESHSQAQEIVPQSRLTPFAIPNLSTIPTANALSLNWTTIFNADGYELDLDGQLVVLGVGNHYLDSPLQSGTHHKYRVRPISGDIKGEWSNVHERWTLPGIPQNIIQQITSTSILFEWDDVVGATSYEIETNNQIVDIGPFPSFEETELNPNTQRTYRIRAKNESGPGAWSPLLVNTTHVSAPGNFRAEPEDNRVLLQWDAVSGATSYNLEIDGTVLPAISENRYLHDELIPSTIHEYRVRANNANGSSLWSQPLIVQTLPSVPRHLSVQAGERSITTQWSPSEGAAAYEIEVDGQVIQVGSHTQYLHEGIEPSSEHQYRVRAINGTVKSRWSAYVTGATVSAVPGNVRAIVISSTEIQLQWDSVSGASAYEVSADGSIINVGLSTVFEHTALMPYSKHIYQVRAIGTGGRGDWSASIEQMTGLGQPQNIIAVPASTSIQLSWDAVDGADQYEIMINGTIIDNGISTTYEHIALSPNTIYVFRVRALNEISTGDWSETILQSTSLGIPQFINVTPSYHQIYLTWNEVPGAITYELEVDGSIIDVGSSTSYTHKGLYPNTSHSYRVRAKNDLAFSEWSNWSRAITLMTTPDMPRNVRTKATATTIQYTWDYAPGASYYEIEFDGIAQETTTSNTSEISGLLPNTLHTFRVRSVGIGGKSPWTDIVQERTAPELSVFVRKDTLFNFVLVLPKQDQSIERYITLTYNPDELQVIDLSAVTPELETGAGEIKNTLFTVIELTEKQIVYRVAATQSTVINSIRFQALTNDYSKITYTIQ